MITYLAAVLIINVSAHPILDFYQCERQGVVKDIRIELDMPDYMVEIQCKDKSILMWIPGDRLKIKESK